MSYCASCGSEHDRETFICPACGADLARAVRVRRATDGDCYQPYGGGGSGGSSGGGGSDDPGGYRPDAPPTDPDAGWQGVAGNPYAAPGYMGAPLQAGGGLFAVGEKRDPVMVLVFTLLTCGIYGWYWWYTVADDMKNALRREDINPMMDIVLGFVTCGIYLIFLYYKYPQMMLEMQDRVRLPRNDISTVTLLLGIFFPLAAIFIIQTELNKIWDAATGARH